MPLSNPINFAGKLRLTKGMKPKICIVLIKFHIIEAWPASILVIMTPDTDDFVLVEVLDLSVWTSFYYHSCYG